MLIKIPIRSHLLKFLKHKIGGEKVEIKHYSQMELFTEDSEVIYIQRELSKTIYPFLNTTIQWEYSQLAKQHRYSLIGLNVKDYLGDQKRLMISFKGVITFNDKIDSLMVTEILKRTEAAISDRRRHDETILEFMAQCGIDEDDIRFDSLKKRCYRERVREKEKIFLAKNLTRTHAVLDLSFSEKLVQS